MRTEIIVILDRSGSMLSICADVGGGFNVFVAEQRTQPGTARMTLVQFDHLHELVYQAKDIQEVPSLNLVPLGSTALYDVIGRTLSEQGSRIEKDGWAELVIVNIITDGEENRSLEFRQADIRTLISSCEAKGWKFIFMAANQDAFKAARNYGISGGLVGNFIPNSRGVIDAYSTTSATVSSLRSGAIINNLVVAN